MNSEILKNDAEVQAYLEEGGAWRKMDAETLKQNMVLIDLMAMDMKPNAVGFIENTQVFNESLPFSTTLTEAEANIIVEEIGGAPGAHSVVQTAVGEGITQAYSAELAGSMNEGVFVIVPSGSGEGLAVINVASSDSARSQEIADNIVKS